MPFQTKNPTPQPPPPTGEGGQITTRRTLLKKLVRGTAAGAGLYAAGLGYGLLEASSLRARRTTVAVPNLPPGFDGATVCVIGDLHHGKIVSLAYVRRVVELANGLNPDLVALVGDFADAGGETGLELLNCLDELTRLRAPLGLFAVPGNHDTRDGGRRYRREVERTPITDLTNRSVAITRGGDELRLAGVDDLWHGKPDLGAALGGVPAGACCVLLCHNPDYAEEKPDARVSLQLSGHTHGGQVVLPLAGAPWTPSKYGEKYRRGLVRGPASAVYVTRGVGETGIPVRVGSPPEVDLLTLTRA